MKILILLAAALGASAGLAQPAQPAAHGPGASAPYDPNEILCQRIQIIGSRLRALRVCRTRQQWAEARREDRMNIEQSQTRRCPQPRCD